MVTAEHLSKRYGSHQALADVCFDAHPGEIFGILGPNGAGKTTAIEIIEGLRPYDEGRVSVLGERVPDGLRRIREQIGVATQRTALPRLLLVEELIGLYVALYPRPRPVSELLHVVGLDDVRRARVGRLSGGQHQRLALALALAGDPAVLFLDEPTSELDPQGRRAVWDLLLDDRRRPSRTVILTTHQMEEAQALCSRVAILDHGRILDVDTPAALVRRHRPGHVVRFTVRDGTSLARLAPFGPAIAPVPRTRSRHHVTLRLTEKGSVREILDVVDRELDAVEDLVIERSSLEDVFLRLTGRQIRH